MPLEGAADLVGIVDVGSSEGDAVGNRGRVPLAQIVDDGHRMSRLEQRADSVAADVAGSAGDYYSRHAPRYLPME
jgi:hypothetical protein